MQFTAIILIHKSFAVTNVWDVAFGFYQVFSTAPCLSYYKAGGDGPVGQA